MFFTNKQTTEAKATHDVVSRCRWKLELKCARVAGSQPALGCRRSPPPSTVLLFLNEAEFTLTGLRLKDRAGFPLTAILWRQERGVF